MIFWQTLRKLPWRRLGKFRFFENSEWKITFSGIHKNYYFKIIYCTITFYIKTNQVVFGFFQYGSDIHSFQTPFMCGNNPISAAKATNIRFIPEYTEKNSNATQISLISNLILQIIFKINILFIWLCIPIFFYWHCLTTWRVFEGTWFPNWITEQSVCRNCVL